MTNKDSLEKPASVSYAKAGSYYFVGTLFNKGISFITVPIFTRLLSTSDYGLATTYNSYEAIFAMIVGFALHMGIRQAFIDYKDEIDDFTSSVVTFTVIAGTIVALLIAGVLSFFDMGISTELMVVCLFHALSAAILQDFSYYLMMKYQYKFRTFLMIAPNLIASIISVIVIVLFMDSNLYLGRVLPLAFVNIAFGLFVVLYIYRKSGPKLNHKYLKYALKLSVPLIMQGIALNILSQSDRLMITAFADSSQTGIYSLIYNFSMIATVITTTLEGIWVPWFLQRLKAKETDKINDMARYYDRFMAFCMVGLLLIGPEIVKVLASEPYWEGISIIPPIVLSNYVIFAYTLYVNIEHYHKKTVFITVNTMIAAATNIVLNYILIPQYGYVAAAYTTLVSYLLSFVLHARYAKRLEPDLYPLKFFVPSILQLTVAVLIFYFAMDMPVIRWILAVIYVAFMAIKYKEVILRFLPERFKKRVTKS